MNPGIPRTPPSQNIGRSRTRRTPRSPFPQKVRIESTESHQVPIFVLRPPTPGISILSGRYDGTESARSPTRTPRTARSPGLRENQLGINPPNSHAKSSKSVDRTHFEGGEMLSGRSVLPERVGAARIPRTHWNWNRLRPRMSLWVFHEPRDPLDGPHPTPRPALTPSNLRGMDRLPRFLMQLIVKVMVMLYST